ncbi:hypothetical protein HZS_6834 [Henneguya salminicola]|nr:hypothetical protein HZS_6834 [Henneguya salminicola]
MSQTNNKNILSLLITNIIICSFIFDYADVICNVVPILHDDKEAKTTIGVLVHKIQNFNNPYDKDKIFYLTERFYRLFYENRCSEDDKLFLKSRFGHELVIFDKNIPKLPVAVKMIFERNWSILDKFKRDAIYKFNLNAKFHTELNELIKLHYVNRFPSQESSEIVKHLININTLLSDFFSEVIKNSNESVIDRICLFLTKNDVHSFYVHNYCQAEVDYTAEERKYIDETLPIGKGPMIDWDRELCADQKQTSRRKEYYLAKRIMKYYYTLRSKNDHIDFIKDIFLPLASESMPQNCFSVNEKAEFIHKFYTVTLEIPYRLTNPFLDIFNSNLGFFKDLNDEEHNTYLIIYKDVLIFTEELQKLIDDISKRFYFADLWQTLLIEEGINTKAILSNFIQLFETKFYHNSKKMCEFLKYYQATSTYTLETCAEPVKAACARYKVHS